MEIEHGTQEQAPSTEARLQLVRNIARALNSTNNAIQLYPPESPMPRESAAGFLAALERYLMFEPHLQLVVSVDSLSLEGEDICGQSPSLQRFAFQLHSRQVGQIRFLPGLDTEECVTFLRILAIDPETIKAKGGLEKALTVKAVRHISVVDLAQEAAAESGGGAAPVEETTRVAGVAALRPEVLIEADPAATTLWLRQNAEEIASRGLAGPEAGAALATVLSEGAGMAAGFEGGVRAQAMDNLASAIGSLDASSRHELLSILLKTQDGGAGALQAILSRIEDADLSGALAHESRRTGLDPSQLIGTDSLDEERRARVAAQAREAAPKAPPQAPTPDVRRSMAPSLPRYSRKGDDFQFSPSQLATEAREFTQPERDSLLHAPREAVEGELMRSATTLLYLLNRSDEEAAAAETIESMLGLVEHALSRAQVGVLVRIVCGLRLKQERCEPSSPLTHRIDQAIDQLSSPEFASGVIRLLTGDPHTLEAATEYFLSAHAVAQEAAIDVLGTDASQELKRQVQAIFAKLGVRAIGVTERHVSDSRWPVALYCVQILAKMREPRVVPALRRAISHDEPRVVEQAVKCLGEIGGREAEEALCFALEQGAGVRLQAIKALGSLQAESAVEPLRRLIAASDAFGRSIEEKIAAVTALGSIGSAQAAQALREAHQKRFFFSPGATSRLRQAAAAELERLTTE